MCSSSSFYGVDHEEIRYRAGDLADVLRSMISGRGAATNTSSQYNYSDSLISSNNPPDYLSSHDDHELLFGAQLDCCVDLGGGSMIRSSDDDTAIMNCSSNSLSYYSNNNNLLLLHQSTVADDHLPTGRIIKSNFPAAQGIITTPAPASMFTDVDGLRPHQVTTSDEAAKVFSPNARAPQTSLSPPPLAASASSPIAVAAGDNRNYVSADQTVHISSSTHNSAAIKRRRSTVAKKVVCVAAPSPANSSRPSGEVVPSDLWAWRKYGQKPIKGSPYPRGYYKCSSSKDCLARKQVERSKTDRDMLVITYTWEHNHPWPTNRNALAGSTRSHTSKNNNNTLSISAASRTQITDHRHSKCNNNNVERHTVRDQVLTDAAAAAQTRSIKGELRDENHLHDQDDSIANHQHLYTTTSTGGAVYEQWCSYRPATLDYYYYYYQNVDEQSQEDFFAEMAGKDALLFS